MLPRFNLVLLLGIVAHAALAQSAAVSPTGFACGVWVGNVTSTSATVAVRLTASGDKVRLQVGPNATLTPAVFSPVQTAAATAGNAVQLSVQGLLPDTDYFYGVEVAGTLRTEPVSRGRFHTFPLGKASFKIAFAGDSHYATPNQSAFDEILAARPLLFIHLGDLHYNDTNTTNPDDYRANYDSVLNQPNEAALFRGVATAYMWDDHDSAGNDCDGTFVGIPTARAVYRERVPHYPIGPTGGAIGQAFTIGRVRVIMTDTRTAATPGLMPESPTKTRLGVAQKAWFKQELINARDAGFPLILWVEPDPWIDPPLLGADTWAGWATERTELANFISVNRITNLVLLSADMHALAYDNGAHSDYATGGGAPLIVLQAAALTESGSIKGGPYTGAPVPGGAQYGLLEVYDDGGPSVACRFLGMKTGAGGGTKLSYLFSTSNVASPGSRALINISTLARVTSAADSILSGFVIADGPPRTVLVRAVGPTLAQFGVTDALATPQLFLFQGSQVIATNAGWAPDNGTASLLTAAFDRTGAFRLVDQASRDAALLLTLAPGAYTLQVRSATTAVGAALIEVYDMSP